jgi:hypothetical protein
VRKWSQSTPKWKTGGVGMQIVQLARHDGVRVLAVTSSEVKVEALLDAGSPHRSRGGILRVSESQDLRYSLEEIPRELDEFGEVRSRVIETAVTEYLARTGIRSSPRWHADATERVFRRRVPVPSLTGRSRR